jgi:uncharacterized protein YndB with AHSA1/START domain
MKYEYDGPRESASITRRFDAPSERLFDAWVDPETASKWLFTTKTSKAEYELDTRVGGSYTITRRRGGKQYVAVGKYLEIDRPRRLVFTFAMPQFAADADTVIVEIMPDGDGCTLTVTQEGLRPGYATSTVKGWSKMFDALVQALG